MTLPTDRAHVVHTHPEWLMVPRELAPRAGRACRRAIRRYVARLAAWTRARVGRASKGCMSRRSRRTPRAISKRIVADLAERYAIDGLHLDYVRYPGPQFDYSAAALAAFRASMLPTLTRASSAPGSTRGWRREPLVYADYFPTRWAEYRRARLADLVARLRTRREDAAAGGAGSAPRSCPMPARRARSPAGLAGLGARAGCSTPSVRWPTPTNLTRFSRQIDEAAHAAARPAGLGRHRRLAPDARRRPSRHIGAARTPARRGVVLFSYDSLAGASRGRSRAIGRGAFGARRRAGRQRSLTEPPPVMVLSPLDYAVIAGYLVAITLFGSWFARFQKTTRDYFLTGRSVPGWAICCTIVATETSTLSFIGVPAQAYAGNMAFLQLVFGYIIGRVDRQPAVPARVLPRRSADVVRAAAAALRRPGEEPERDRSS